MNKKVNTFQNVVMLILFLFVVIFLLFLNRLTAVDELWNFQNVCKMSNGLKIYTDANVIITPIFFYVASFLCKLFGANIVVFRIYNVLIYIGIFGATYKILKDLKACKYFLVLYIALIIEFMFPIINAGANYNMLAIALALMGLNLYVNKKNNNINQGILIFLIFFTKQNIGVLYAMAIIIYELYKNKFSKKFILDQLKKFLFFIIPTGIMILQMYLNGNLLDFINYAFGGLFDFGTNNITFVADSFFLLMPIVVIILYIFVCVKKNNLLKDIINQEVFDNLTLLFIFSMMMTFIIYPIINTAHVLMVMPLYLIFVFYLFDVLILESLFGEEKYVENIKWMSIAIGFILVVRIVANLSAISDARFITDENSHFYGIYVLNSIVEKSEEIEEYIKEQNENGIDVMILASDAAYPMINLEQSHGVYDLLFNGNMGYNGIEKIKEDLSNRENTQVLIVTEFEDLFWQESLEIRDFIQENFESTGEICNYTIYSINCK